MTKDNSTGKNKEFYELGKKMFDRIPPIAQPEQAVQPAIAQEPTSAEYAQGYAAGFNDACRPVQPGTIALIKECRDALAEEIAAYDIDPPLHHLVTAHDKCVAWLVGAGVLVYCTACERNVKGPCNSVECSTPEPTPQPVQIGDKT